MGTSANVTINITAQGRNAQQVIALIRAQLAGIGPTFQQNTRQANNFGNAISKLRNQVFALKLAYEGAQFFSRFISEGLKFNQVVETGTLAIGTLITATGRLETADGRVLVGIEALNEGLKLAADQVNKLRVDGLRTAATTEQLIDAFQQATGAGIAAGLTLDQIRRTTVQIVLAAGNLGVPMNQLNQEVRSILEATIDRNSRVARILGITNAQVKLAREQGTLAQFLNEKLQAFTVASEKSLETWQVIRSNMVEAFQVLAGDVTKPFFDRVKKGFEEVLGSAFDFDRAQINESFRGLIEGGQAFFAEFGDIVQEAIHTAVVGAQNLSEWFRQNRTEVQLFTSELGETARAIGSMIGQVVRVLAGIVKWGIESGTFNAGLKVAQLTLSIIEKLAGVIVFGALIKAAGAALSLAKNLGLAMIPFRGLAGGAGVAFNLGRTLAGLANPVTIAITAVAGLVSVLSLLESRQEMIKAQKDALIAKLREEKAATTDLSTGYVELARNILNGTATNQEMANTLSQLAAKSDDLSKANDAFSEKAGQHAQKLRVLAGAITANVRARENLAVEAQKLEAQLQQGDLKGPERIRIQNRLNEITREMGGLQRVYGDMVKETNQAIETNIDLQLQAAQSRLAAAQGERAAAASILADLEARKAQLEIAQQGTLGDADRRKEIGRELLELNDRIRFYRSTMVGFADGTEKARAALAKLQSEIARGRGVTLTGVRGFTEGDAAKKEAARRQAEQDLKKDIEAQIEIIKANERRVTEELKNALEANKISIADFTSQTVKTQIGAIEEIVALRRRLIAGLSEVGDRKQQLGEIRELQIAAIGIITGAHAKRVELEKDLNEKILKAREELAASEGKLAEAAGLKFEKEWGDTLAQLRANKDIGSIEILMTLKGREQVKAGIEGIFNTVELAQQRLDTSLASIQARVAAGALLPADAKREVISSYQAMQQEIDKARAKLFLLFAMTKNPDVLVQIEKLTEEWNKNAAAIENAKNSLEGFKLALFEAVESGFVEFLTADLSALDKFDNAFREMALSIIRSIRQMIAQMIAFRAVSAIFGAFGTPIPAGNAPFQNDAGALFGATGGYIQGPGTETSDSIPARLSRGEYVLSARTVRRVGIGLLDQLNFGASRPRLRKRRFASGGLVEGEAHSGARGELTATIGLEDGLVLKTIRTSSGRESLLKLVTQNQKAFRAALGL